MGAQADVVVGTAVMGVGFFLFLDFMLHSCGHRWIGAIDMFDPRCGHFGAFFNLPPVGERQPQPSEQTQQEQPKQQTGGGQQATRTGDCASGSQAIGDYAWYNVGGAIDCCYKAFCYNKNAGKPFCMCSPSCATAKTLAVNYCNSGGGGGIAVPPQNRPPPPARQVPVPTQQQLQQAGYTNTFPCQTSGGTKYVKDRATCCKTYGMLCPDGATRVCYGDPCPKGSSQPGAQYKLFGLIPIYNPFVGGGRAILEPIPA